MHHACLNNHSQGYTLTFWLSKEHVLGVEVAGQHWELGIGDCLQSFQKTHLHSVNQ